MMRAYSGRRTRVRNTPQFEKITEDERGENFVNAASPRPFLSRLNQTADLRNCGAVQKRQEGPSALNAPALIPSNSFLYLLFL